MSEINEMKYTNGDSPQNGAGYSELSLISANLQANEIAADSGGTAKKPGAFSKVFSLVSAALVAAVAGIAVLPSNVKVTRAAYEAGATVIYYYIGLDNLQEGDSAELRVTNAFTDRAVTLSAEAVGEVEGLKPDMEYKVSVVSGGKTLDEQKVRTLNESYYAQ